MQNALERLIEQLIQDYIDEIEKIALVVINNKKKSTQLKINISCINFFN